MFNFNKNCRSGQVEQKHQKVSLYPRPGMYIDTYCEHIKSLYSFKNNYYGAI